MINRISTGYPFSGYRVNPSRVSTLSRDSFVSSAQFRGVRFGAAHENGLVTLTMKLAGVETYIDNTTWMLEQLKTFQNGAFLEKNSRDPHKDEENRVDSKQKNNARQEQQISYETQDVYQYPLKLEMEPNRRRVNVRVSFNHAGKEESRIIGYVPQELTDALPREMTPEQLEKEFAATLYRISTYPSFRKPGQTALSLQIRMELIHSPGGAPDLQAMQRIEETFDKAKSAEEEKIRTVGQKGKPRLLNAALVAIESISVDGYGTLMERNDSEQKTRTYYYKDDSGKYSECGRWNYNGQFHVVRSVPDAILDMMVDLFKKNVKPVAKASG